MRTFIKIQSQKYKHTFLNYAELLQYLLYVLENMKYEAKNMVTIANICEVEGRQSMITPLCCLCNDLNHVLA